MSNLLLDMVLYAQIAPYYLFYFLIVTVFELIFFKSSKCYTFSLIFEFIERIRSLIRSIPVSLSLLASNSFILILCTE